MADSKLDDYFARREGTLFGAPQEGSLSRRAAEKKLRLAEKKARQEEEDAAWEASAAGQAGIEQNTLPGDVYNLMQTFGPYAIKAGGEAVAAPFEGRTAVFLDGITAEQLDAYERKTAGEEITPEEQVSLDERADFKEQILNAKGSQWGLGVTGFQDSAENRIARAESSAGIARDIREATDATELAYTGDKDDVLEAVGDVFDENDVRRKWDEIDDPENKEAVFQATSALSEAIKGSLAAFNANKRGTAQLLVSELSGDVGPAAVAKVGMGIVTATNVDRALKSYNTGRENFIEEHGREPNEEEADRMAFFSSAKFLLSQGSANFLASRIAKTGRALSGAGKSGAKEVIKAPARAAGAGVVENLSEVGETYAEGQAEHDPRSAREIFTAGMAGQAIGTLASAPTAAAETARGAAQGAADVAEKAAPLVQGYREKRRQQQDAEDGQKPVDEATREEAAQTSNVEAMTDPASDQYNPEEAMKVLLKRNADTTVPDEEKGRNETTAAKLVTQVEEEVSGLRARLNETTSSDQRDMIEEKVAQREQELADLPEDATPTVRQDLQQKVANGRQMLKDLDEENTGKEQQKKIKKAEAQLGRAERRLQHLTDMSKNMAKRGIPDAETRATLVQQADNAPDSEGSQTAITEVVRLAMEAPDSLDPVEVGRLASNPDNGLSSEQRTLLTRFSEARQRANAEKGAKGVSKEIYTGGNGNIGINQYRERMVSNLKADNRTRARAQLDGIEQFAERQRNKAEMGKAALADIDANAVDTESIDLVYDPQTGWQRSETPLSDKERSAAGAFRIDERSRNQLKRIEQEADDIEAAALEMRSMYDIPQSAERMQRATQAANGAEASAPAEDIAATQQSNNEAPQTEASVPVMMTQGMRRELSDLGFQEQDIRQMTPQQAWDVLNEPDTAPAQSTSDGAAATPQQAEPETVKRYTPQSVRQGAEEHKVYVFGDNLLGRGKKGQAMIRDEPNAIGIPTKRKPAMSDDAFFGQNVAEEKAAITTAVDRVIEARNQGKTVVMPEDGIGTGLADLQQRSPEVYEHLQAELARGGLVQQGNTETTQETADAQPAPAETATAESAVRRPAPEAESTQPAESAPTADESVDQSPEPSPASAVVEDDEATAEEDADRPTDDVTEDATQDADVDPETGEVIEGAPAQNNDAETNGEGIVFPLSRVAAGVKRTVGQLGERFFEANVVAEYLRQDARDLKRRVTKRPLVEIRNFLTQLRADRGLAQKFVSEGLTEEQRALVDDLASQLPVFSEQVKGTLRPVEAIREEFRHEDYIEYFQDLETGELDENTLTAISLAMYAWLGDNVSNRWNDKRAVNKILDQQSKAPVTPKQQQRLGPVGTRQSVVIQELGTRAAEALGFTVENGVPQDVMPKVVSALGGRALAGLRAAGMIETNEIPDAEMVELKGEDPRSARGKVTHKFVQIPLAQGNASRARAELIQETMQGTQSFLPKLFGVEDRKLPPTLKPVAFKGRKPKRSNMAIPETLERILADANRQAHYVREDEWAAWNSLDPLTQVQVAGGTNLEQQRVQKAQRASIEAKNEALAREATNLKEQVGDLQATPNGLMTPFYLDRQVWKMQRVGLLGTKVNPQTSKIHRGLVRMGGWEHTVDLENDDGTLDEFWLAVGEALGVNTDGMRNLKSIPKAQQKAASPVIEAGVIAIMKSRNNEVLTPEDNAAIAAAVDDGGEDMHSFQGLVTLARYLEASERGDRSFTHTLTREIDGKTNGPMFGQMLLGAANTAGELLDMVRRGGFFTARDGVDHIGEWAEDGTQQDLYQHVLKALHRNANATLTQKAWNRPLYSAIAVFTGRLVDGDAVTSAGRNLVKTPVTALQFGSATDTVIQDMGKELLDKVYTTITKLDRMDPDSREREVLRQQVIGALNRLLADKDRGVAQRLSLDTTVDQLMEIEIKGKDYDTFVSKFKNTFGKDIKATLEDVFAPFIARRKHLNRAANAAYELYQAVYEVERHRYYKELVASGGVPRGKIRDRKTVLQYLTKEQEDEVRARVASVLPRVHTAFSKYDGNLDAGISLIKNKRQFDPQAVFQNVTKMPAGAGAPRIYSSGQRTVDEAPGVAGLIWQIHSADSFTAAMTYAKHQALNVHDAVVVTPGDAVATGQDFNRHTFEMLTFYSPARETSEALERTMKALVSYMEENGLEDDPQFKARLAKAVEKINLVYDRSGKTDMGAKVLSRILKDSRRVALTGDKIKFQTMRQMTSISQYTVEGGHHEVTEAERLEVNRRLKETNAELSNLDAEGSTFGDVATTLEGYLAPQQTTEVEPEIVETSPEGAESAETSSTGVSQDEDAVDSATDMTEREPVEDVPGSDADPATAEGMLQALEADRGMSPQALINVAMKGATPAVARLLQRLKQHKLVGQVSVSIHDADSANPGEYVRSTMTDTRTGESSVNRQVNLNLPWLRERVAGRRASPQSNTPAETVAEIIAHELVHAATEQAINDTSNTGKRLSRRLEAIQGDIKAWMAENPEAVAALDEGTRHQLEVMSRKINEIPTYGMTAKRIQNVLKRIPSRQSKNSAWSRFVKAIREALNLTNTDPSVLDEVIAVTDSAMRARPETNDAGTIRLSIGTGPEADGPMHYTTRQIFDVLSEQDEERSDEQQQTLDRLLSQVVDRLHGPFDAFKEQARQNEAVSPEDAFFKALDSGQMPFVSKSRAAGFSLTDAEAFVLEQVEAVMEASMEFSNTNDLARGEIETVWREARANEALKQALTDEQWTFLFRLNRDNGNTDDHMARFAALGMVHPEVRRHLDFASRPNQGKRQDPTLVQRLQDLFRRLLDLFHGRLTRTYSGQRADDKVWTLMDRLVEIESRRRRRLADNSVTWMDQAEDKLGGVMDAARDRAVSLGRSDFVANRKTALGRAVPKVAAVVAGERTDELMNNMEGVRQQMFEAKQGVLASLISEARGAHDKAIQGAHKLLRSLAKKNEQERMRQYEMYRQAVLESFSDNGKNLSNQDKESLTKVLLDADLSGLLGAYDEAGLVELVEDPRALKQAAVELESELKAASPTWHRYHTGAARDLGHYKVTGEVTSQHLMMNAHNITRLFGTKHQGKINEADASRIEPLVDRLTSLYALQAMPIQKVKGRDVDHLQQVAQVMRQELARGNASGVGMTLGLHQRMKEDAQEVLFEGEKALMQKGYRSQIYNPYKTAEAVPVAQQQDYEAMGYITQARLPLDPHDPNGEQKVLMVVPDGGMNRRLTGTVAYTNEVMQGSPIHGGESSPAFDGRNPANQRKNQKLLAERDAYIESLVRQGDQHTPSTGGFKSYLAPTVNRQGEVVNYRYLMKDATKDMVMDRNNAIDDVFGAMAGHAFDKVATKEQNRTAIEALKAQYDEEYAQNPGAYVRIAADAKDKQHAEAFRLLPDDTKRAVREIWGGQEMWVRGDLVDINFGYQKPSLADSFKKDPEQRNAAEKIMVNVIETMFEAAYVLRGKGPKEAKRARKRAFLRMRQVGGVWTEIVKELKDILVVKTGFTLLGNQISNMSLLMWHGVSAADMARHHRVAFEGILRFRQERNELDKLRLKLGAGQTVNQDEIEQRIIELEKSLERNPVAFMIDEGLMPTIVEDVDLHEDPYSYKSALQEGTEQFTKRIPKAVRTVGRYAYMAHDTPLYKAFSQGTQLSDFVARYTLYQHVTTRKRNRMSHDEAIQRASDMFINYDVPTHRLIQYLNDIGLLMFTKYYIRIQRAILTLYREHPARGMLMVALNSIMPGLSLLTESGALNKIGNPLEWGALGYPEVLDEIATVKAALSPFN